MSKWYPTSLAPYPKWWQFRKRRQAKKPVHITLNANPRPDDVNLKIIPTTQSSTKSEGK